MPKHIKVTNIDPDDHEKVKKILESKGMTLSGWFRLKERELIEGEK